MAPDAEAEDRIAAGDDLAAVARLAAVLAKGGLPPDAEAGLRLRRGTCFFRLAQFDAALAHAREVSSGSTPLGKTIHRADALQLAAECLRRLGRWAEAAQAYRDASAEAPDSARRRASNFFAALAEEEGGDLAASERAWREFIAAHEGDAEGQYRLGLVFERRGDLASARASYERVAASGAPGGDAGPDEVRAAALFRIAMIERKGGNLEAAIRRLEEATQAAGETFLGTTARSLAADLRGEWGLAKRGMRAYDPKT